jgi:hypothetical protein
MPDIHNTQAVPYDDTEQAEGQLQTVMLKKYADNVAKQKQTK